MTNIDLDQDEIDIIQFSLDLDILKLLLKRLNEFGKDWDYDNLSTKVDKLLEKLET